MHLQSVCRCPAWHGPLSGGRVRGVGVAMPADSPWPGRAAGPQEAPVLCVRCHGTKPRVPVTLVRAASYSARAYNQLPRHHNLTTTPQYFQGAIPSSRDQEPLFPPETLADASPHPHPPLPGKSERTTPLTNVLAAICEQQCGEVLCPGQEVALGHLSSPSRPPLPRGDYRGCGSMQGACSRAQSA